MKRLSYLFTMVMMICVLNRNTLFSQSSGSTQEIEKNYLFKKNKEKGLFFKKNKIRPNIEIGSGVYSGGLYSGSLIISALVKDKFTIGIQLAGLESSNSSQTINTTSVNEYSITHRSYTYYGLQAGYRMSPEKTFHLNFPLMIGFGYADIDYTRRKEEKISAVTTEHTVTYNNSDGDDTGFFIIQPKAELEINVFNFFRVGLGMKYNFVSGINAKGLSDGRLSGFGGDISLKFGNFK